MNAGIVRRALVLALLFPAALAGATPLTLTATYGLGAALSAPSGNFFHPQGLGYDDVTGELLFAQEGTSEIVRTDHTGAVLGTVALGSGGETPGHYAVAVAANATGYFVSDYWANATGYDVLSTPRTGGDLTPVGGERAALVGTPLDVRGNALYRTEATVGRFSNDALYGRLATVRVSDLSAPDTILRTLDLETPTGIGDLTVDLKDASLFVLGYGNGNVYRYDLNTGGLLDEYDLGLPSLSAGIAFGDGNLYHYAWNEGSGSVLSVYRFGAVPEPASFLPLALGALALGRRRARHAQNG